MTGTRGKLDPARAALVVIDVQDGFRKMLPDGFDAVVSAAATLVEGAAAVGMPIHLTEQYPKGLGPTASELAERLPAEVQATEKVCFSALDADGFDLGGREQALLCGIEAHVCVSQTALDLLARGVEVHLAEDAVASRFERNKEIGLRKLEREGALVTSVETALFELVGAAGSDEFKRIQRLILDYAPNPA